MTWDALSEPDRLRVKSWQRWMLLLAVICELFLAADWYAFAAVIPFISKTLSLNPAEAGWAQGIFALTYGIGMFFWSPVSRNMSARTMLMIGLAGTGLGMVLQIFVQNFTELMILRLIIGFFDAAIFIGDMKLIFGWFPQWRRGTVVGIILAAYSLAITLDFALGIPLAIAVGWRTFFAVLAIGTLVVAAIDWFCVRNDPTEIGLVGFRWDTEPVVEGRMPLSTIFKSKWIAVGGFGIASATFAIAGEATWVVPAFITVQHMPVASAAVIGTLMGVSQIVFLVIGGYIADSLGKALIIKVGTFLALITAVLFVFATIYPMSFGWLVVLAALSGLGVFGGGAIFSLLAEKYPQALVPAAIGYAECFGIFSSFLAPLMMGVIINSTKSFTEAFVAFAVVELIFMLILIAMAREQRVRSATMRPAE